MNMRTLRQTCRAILALIVLPRAFAQMVTVASLGLIDNDQSQYFSTGRLDKLSLTSEGAACVKASLLGVPCTQAAARASAQAEQILKCDVFTLPSAVISLQTTGATPGMESKIRSRAIRKLDLVPGSSAAILKASLAAMPAGTSNPLHVYHADYAALHGCNDACMESLVQESVFAIGGNYTASAEGPMQGIARVPQWQEAGSQAVALPLQELPVRLWAAELAVLHHTAISMAAEHEHRDPQHESSKPWLLEGTLVGLEALSQNTPGQLAGASTAQRAIISLVQDILSDTFDDRQLPVADQFQIDTLNQYAFYLMWQLRMSVCNGMIAYMLSHVQRRVATIVAEFKKTNTAGSLQGLLQWRANALPSTDAESFLSSLGGTLPTGGRNSLNWQTDAAAWLAFMVIVVFLAAGIHSLTNMQFKKDSLLYGRTKAD